MGFARCPALLLTISLIGGLGAAAPACFAAQPWGGSLALTTDYVYRGLSQNCGAPAAQAGLYYRTAANRSAPQNFVGIWGSTALANSSCRARTELNAYLGRTWLVNTDNSVTFTYVHTHYPDSGELRYDYDEIQGAWAWEDQVFFTVGWSPNAVRYSGPYSYGPSRGRHALSYGLELHHSLPLPALTASVGVGYDQLADLTGTGYGFWNAGLAYAAGDVQLDLSYFATASRAVHLFSERIAGRRWSATLIWRF